MRMTLGLVQHCNVTACPKANKPKTLVSPLHEFCQVTKGNFFFSVTNLNTRFEKKLECHLALGTSSP